VSEGCLGRAASIPESVHSPNRELGSSTSRLHPVALLRHLLGTPDRLQAMRSCCRPHYRDRNDFGTGFTRFALGPGSLERVRARAKELGGSINDLWLAGLLMALAPLAPQRSGGGRRHRLAAGCIVNLRKDPASGSTQGVGVQLGAFTVRHAAPPGAGLAEVVRDIHKQTQRIKANALYAGFGLDLALGRCAMRWYRPSIRTAFYAKHFPLWGGVTNLNLNPLWPPAAHWEGFEYWRGVSTGPLTPLVLSISTSGPAMQLSLSYRTAVYRADQVEALQDRFRQLVLPACSG
jgi:hypothetical protein